LRDSTIKKNLTILLTLFISLMVTVSTRADTVWLQPVGDETTWPAMPYRWMDVADFLYSSDYRDNFTYNQPTVTLTFCDTSNVFRGTLFATGLKPNFAYQVKLVGKPEKIWDSDGDDWTNEQLGYAGRWWRTQPNPGNTSDTDYDLHKDDPDYIFEGYLLFAFFVTNEQGNATSNITVDSSFHVLWATHDSSGDGTGHNYPGVNDSPVRYYDFSASPATNANAYDVDHGSGHVGIYAEWEAGRALPGELVLPEGLYRCQFILTEESFHQTDLGGGWAGAMEYTHLQFALDHDAVLQCRGDFNCDDDVDGIDLATYISDSAGISLEDFAGDFGKTDCR
jgi:hypothetical protein